MGNIACFVACGSTKRESRNPSWGLYNSTLFEKSWSAAMLLGDPYVMSAKHHLLSVDDRLGTYDKTLNNFTEDERIMWASEVLKQLPEHYETLVLFGGRNYVEPIKEMNDDLNIIDVYEGTSGNGQQMSVAGDIIETQLSGGNYLYNNYESTGKGVLCSSCNMNEESITGNVFDY